MISAGFLTTCIVLAQKDSAGSPVLPTTVVGNLDFTKDVADDTLHPSLLESDPNFEARFYYYGLPSSHHTGPHRRGAACGEGGWANLQTPDRRRVG